MHTHICTHAHTHARTHICTHAHTHTDTLVHSNTHTHTDSGTITLAWKWNDREIKSERDRECESHTDTLVHTHTNTHTHIFSVGGEHNKTL